MDYTEMEEAVKTYLLENINTLRNNYTVALRYDNIDMAVGSKLEDSKTNTDREDSRDFPEFGTKDYNDMETLNGTCCYILNNKEDYRNFTYEIEDFMEDEGLRGSGIVSKESSLFNHCSIVIGIENTDCMQLLEDEGEILLTDCVVVKRLW